MYKGISERKAIVAGENTHNYKDGINYVHCFRYSQSAEYYLKVPYVLMNSLEHYIAYMVLNIPNEILNNYFGYGYYDVPRNNNTFSEDLIPLPEYAIPEELIKPEYIVAVNNFIDSRHKSSDDEYKKYLDLVYSLLEKYDYNHYTVTRYLMNNNLEELLGVVVDDRDEQQIMDDNIKQLYKIWKGYD